MRPDTTCIGPLESSRQVPTRIHAEIMNSIRRTKSGE
jgi:hypothetical protein